MTPEILTQIRKIKGVKEIYPAGKGSIVVTFDPNPKTDEEQKNELLTAQNCAQN